MELFFSLFRNGIIGQNKTIKTPYHESVRILYADWTASGRMYLPIEERILKKILPFTANTHTEANTTGVAMTYAYQKARQIIKQHAGANDQDVLISSGAGMTGVINKLQRILGFRLHESFKQKIVLTEDDRPVVFITHMEHHSNQTSWLETIAEVVVVPPDENGLVAVENFRQFLKKYQHRKIKIAAITACSNVTGIMTPYMEIAALFHQFNGWCFIDFACSAPYVSIDMHVNDKEGYYLDAIYFSPHKFLGGPGATGILIFNKKLYSCTIPDHPGGGTVDWTNPWGRHKYVNDFEEREDGGTPAFLQTIRAAMCLQLKNEMGVENIQKREKEILKIVWDSLVDIPGIHILAKEHKERLGILSFYIDGLHYNLGVKLLNDKFGIQARGGCSCAGTYGHYLLNIDAEKSNSITAQITQGDRSGKPGWIRLSFHPTHTNAEIKYVMDAVKQLAKEHKDWSKDYNADFVTGNIEAKDLQPALEMKQQIDGFFNDRFFAYRGNQFYKTDILN
jgi:selenocysteine lyase/cysteine desulfurase